MDMLPFFSSIIGQDPMPVVICGIDHRILYMNPAAIEHYSDRGGKNLIGLIIFDCHRPETAKIIKEVVEWFAQNEKNNIVHTFFSETMQRDVYMVALRDEEGRLIGYYEKHESRKRDPSAFYNMG